MKRALPILFLLCSCRCPHPSSGTHDSGPPSDGTTLEVHNRQAVAATVSISFGSDSEIKADSWSFCSGTGLACTFQLDGQTGKPLPLNGQYLNATFAFNDPVGCGSTKAEVNLNNPKWFDTLDVSLVDGFSNRIQIEAEPSAGVTEILGPPAGKEGNEKVYGLFPYGCDICVAQQNPPCGIPAGGPGCKAGRQSDPDPVCQVQGPTKGGGGQAVRVVLLPD